MNEEGPIAAPVARNDDELLRRFITTGSEEAFAEIVRRYTPLVYGVSLRELDDREMAEDVTQVVFLVFAKKAGAIHGGWALASWLFHTTCLTVRQTARQERRRRAREQQWMAETRRDNSQSEVWDHARWSLVEPDLNEALRSLRRADLECVLLHYFQGWTLREFASLVREFVTPSPTRTPPAPPRAER